MDKETAHRVHLARWRRFVTAFLIISIICAAVGLYTSPLLRVQRLEVVGATAVSADEVGSLARLDGDSMMRLDFASAAERVETIPMVQSARLERRWPQTVRTATSSTPKAWSCRVASRSRTHR
jgi:cell division protein FtsQ